MDTDSKHFLTHDVKYIEPILDPHHLCRIHYPSHHIDVAESSEALINTVLLGKYGTNIKARREHLKMMHDIHKLGPIVIDERYQFVLFPLTVCRKKNPFWVNLNWLLLFSQRLGSTSPTRIHFNDGTTVDIAQELKFCEKQYDKTLRVLDRSIKLRDYTVIHTGTPPTLLI